MPCIPWLTSLPVADDCLILRAISICLWSKNQDGRIAFAVCLTILLFSLPIAKAQDTLTPTVAVVQFGDNAVTSFVTAGIVNVLHAYGFVLADEMNQSDPGHPLREGLAGAELANLNLHFFSADYDFAALQFVVDGALDVEPDIIIAIEEMAALSVVNATASMEAPPVVLFGAVPNPYSAAIADANCVKPGACHRNAQRRAL